MCDDLDDYDDLELYNQCEEVEISLSQSQPDDIAIEEESILLSSSDESEAPGNPANETPPENRRSTPSSSRISRSSRQRNITTNQRKIAQELNCYRREEVREKNYHDRQLRKIDVELKRIEMEIIRFQTMNSLLGVLTSSISKHTSIEPNESR